MVLPNHKKNITIVFKSQKLQKILKFQQWRRQQLVQYFKQIDSEYQGEYEHLCLISRGGHSQSKIPPSPPSSWPRILFIRVDRTRGQYAEVMMLMHAHV